MSLSDADFDFVRTLVRRDSAIVMDDTKKYLVISRLADLAATRADGSIRKLVDALRNSPDSALHDSVVEAMAIQETLFFRDTAFFDAMREQIIPDLIRRRDKTRRLRLWCAACSTGQEPYSVCMMLRENFPQLANWRIEFVASDFSGNALRRASDGRYSLLEVNRGLPARYLAKYFSQHGLDWSIAPELRQMIDFRQINLIQAWPELPTFDVVLLRNVLIYFDMEARRTVLSRCRENMANDGYLFLGGTETTTGLDETFRPLASARGGSCFQLGGGN